MVREKVGTGQEVGDEDSRWGECVDSRAYVALPSHAHLECSLLPASSAQGDKRDQRAGKEAPQTA